MNHKRRRPKNRRGGCLRCKPCKALGHCIKSRGIERVAGTGGFSKLRADYTEADAAIAKAVAGDPAGAAADVVAGGPAGYP